MQDILLIIILLINLYAYILMIGDKRKAIQGKWRTSEYKLLITGCCFGSIGIILGMLPPVNHKKNKWKFSVLMPLVAIVQVVGLWKLKSIFNF